MPIQSLLVLIFCNLIWSAHPLMSKWVLEDLTPAQGAWMRYLWAAATYLLLSPFLRRFGPVVIPFRDRKNWVLITIAGGSAFFFAPLLQLKGLSLSRATDNALLIAMEPLMTVFLGWIILRDRVTRLQGFALFFACLGFSLLAQISKLSFTSGAPLGNLIMLTSLSGEAMWSVLAKKLRQTESAVSIFGSSVLCGVLALSIALLLLGSPVSFIEAFTHLHMRSFLGLLWLGPLGTAGGYIVWVTYVKKGVPLAAAALTLFFQPLIGAVLGTFFLHEHLTLMQWAGGFVILLAGLAGTSSRALAKKMTES